MAVVDNYLVAKASLRDNVKTLTTVFGGGGGRADRRHPIFGDWES